jgi:hypothetical protein
MPLEAQPAITTAVNPRESDETNLERAHIIFTPLTRHFPRLFNYCDRANPKSIHSHSAPVTRIAG